MCSTYGEHAFNSGLFIYFSSADRTATQKFELASFLRWYIMVELHDPAYAKRFYSIYEILEDSMIKVCWLNLLHFKSCIIFHEILVLGSIFLIMIPRTISSCYQVPD